MHFFLLGKDLQWVINKDTSRPQQLVFKITQAKQKRRQYLERYLEPLHQISGLGTAMNLTPASMDATICATMPILANVGIFTFQSIIAYIATFCDICLFVFCMRALCPILSYSLLSLLKWAS